jgi:hypothetical protein
MSDQSPLISAVQSGLRVLHRDNFADEEYLEKFLLPALGLNNEQLHEQPPELSMFYGNGLGLRIFQYPNQFSKYLSFLAKFPIPIRSYLEIGCRHGGTFITTAEILQQLEPSFKKAVALDIIDESVNLREYRRACPGTVEYLLLNSLSPEFDQYLKDKFFDLVLIDGDHSYSAVQSDSEKTFERANIQVFHDTFSDACQGVVNYWAEYKVQNSATHEFFDFTEQYESVNGNFLGIGVAVRKQWLNR